MPSHPDDVIAALDGLTAREAFELLKDWEPVIDWAGLPGVSLPMSEGGRLRFEKRRRSVSIERPDGGVWVIDLGRRDRMRSLAAILTSDLVRVDGPDLVVALTPAWSEDRGEIAVRDPLDGKGKRAATSVPVGTYRTSRYLDPSGRPALVAAGALDGVSGFGTFLMNGGTGYAHLRTLSGLGGLSDAGRTTFMKPRPAGPSASSSTFAGHRCTTAPSWIPSHPEACARTERWRRDAHRSIASGWRGSYIPTSPPPGNRNRVSRPHRSSETAWVKLTPMACSSPIVASRSSHMKYSS
jgi:hypothetical protein